MPDWLVVVILGIIEGITEFIPVSSTGHLLLAEHFLPNGEKWVGNDLFNIVIQSAAVVAVVPLFRNRFQQLRDWKSSAVRNYWFKVAASFAITVVGGLVLDRLDYKLPETALPVAMALLLGGLFFLLAEGWLRGKVWHEEITWTVAVAVGVGQLIAAVCPGASRSGTTILLALLLGLSRPAATEFSFLVGIPTMLAAGGWKILKVFLHSASAPNWWHVLLGAIVSAIVSFFAVKWLLRFVQTHTFVGFGWYRVVFGIVLLIALLS